jgi:uncharacterized SAM-binding protein YcdF (DUF218 family)
MKFGDGRPGMHASPEHGGIILRMLFLIFFLALLVVVYLARQPILRLAGGFWVVGDTPQPSDAIVILANDDYEGDRATRAAELFKAGWAPHIVASGQYLRPYASAAELEQHDLSERGVPASAITKLAHRGRDTREEAVEVSAALSSHGWKKILIVTSNYHTRRARYIYQRMLPAGCQVRVIAARDAEYDPDRWWQSRAGTKIFFRETAAFFVALWELRKSEVRTS